MWWRELEYCDSEEADRGLQHLSRPLLADVRARQKCDLAIIVAGLVVTALLGFAALCILQPLLEHNVVHTPMPLHLAVFLWWILGFCFRLPRALNLILKSTSLVPLFALYWTHLYLFAPCSLYIQRASSGMFEVLSGPMHLIGVDHSNASLAPRRPREAR